MFRNLRVGDTVRVKSNNWYATMANSSDEVVLPHGVFTQNHARYCSAYLVVHQVNTRYKNIICTYDGRILELRFTTDMFESLAQNVTHELAEREREELIIQQRIENPFKSFKIFYKGGEDNIETLESLIVAKSLERAKLIWEESNNAEKYIESVEVKDFHYIGNEEKIII